MATYIKHNDQYYILSSSSLADDRTMVLKYGDAFAVYDRFGDIHPIGSGAQGIYFEGMRFLSKSELLIENRRALLLSSSLKEENEILTVDLTNPDFEQAKGDLVEKGNLHIHRSKFLWKDAFYEQISFSNFGTESMTFRITLLFEADFSDIFEVRGMQRKSRGTLLQGKASSDEILIGYKGKDDVIRKSRIRFNTHAIACSTEKAEFQFTLEPQEVINLSYSLSFEAGDKIPEVFDFETAHDLLVAYLRELKENSCDLFTSHDQFNNWLVRSRADMDTMVSETRHGMYPYAGVPWYSCPFGRDGIITAIQYLWMNPDLARGVLNFCAKTQAKSHNDFQDAEPGKIFHEKRGGEMAELGEIPFKMYYGTIDATPLFIILAGLYLERTNDIQFIKEIWPNIEAALEWIDKYGDSDGDGFIEYKKKSEIGLINQGWKDSVDSVMYENGKLAEGSIALCEVQAYAYDAKMRAADIADELGLNSRGQELRNQAERLQAIFIEKFWDEDKKTFHLALDGEKKPCKVTSSNAGHCLFSGIATRVLAEDLVPTLMSEKMFSGWGIRTLASDEVKYNPMSYHNGSVWPHDNAMIAYGMALYGFHDQVHKVLKGLFDMTMYVEHQRLPELFCGFKKRRNEGPTAYPVACSPQAWAVGSVYMLLQACLGIRVAAKESTIYFFKPSLPDFLNELTITNLSVNNSTVALQLRRDNNGGVDVNVLHKEGDVKIEVINEYLCSKRLPAALEKSLKVECTV
jgi:glycogen debranching enzyme